MTENFQTIYKRELQPSGANFGDGFEIKKPTDDNGDYIQVRAEHQDNLAFAELSDAKKFIDDNIETIINFQRASIRLAYDYLNQAQTEAIFDYVVKKELISKDKLRDLFQKNLAEIVPEPEELKVKVELAKTKYHDDDKIYAAEIEMDENGDLQVTKSGLNKSQQDAAWLNVKQTIARQKNQYLSREESKKISSEVWKSNINIVGKIANNWQETELGQKYLNAHQALGHTVLKAEVKLNHNSDYFIAYPKENRQEDRPEKKYRKLSRQEALAFLKHADSQAIELMQEIFSGFRYLPQLAQKEGFSPDDVEGIKNELYKLMREKIKNFDDISDALSCLGRVEFADIKPEEIRFMSKGKVRKFIEHLGTNNPEELKFAQELIKGFNYLPQLAQKEGFSPDDVEGISKIGIDQIKYGSKPELQNSFYALIKAQNHTKLEAMVG